MIKESSMFNVDLDFNIDAGFGMPPIAVRAPEIAHHASGFDMKLPYMDFVVGGVLIMCVVALGMLCCYCAKKRDSTRFDARLEAIVARMEAAMDRNSVELMPHVDQPLWYLRARGLQQSLIDAIKVVKYEKDAGLVEGNECAICLSEFEEEDSLRLLPKCGHAFHVPCIDQWFGSHSNCPLCRSPITHAMVVTEVPLFTPEVVLEWARSNRLERAYPAALGGQQSDEVVIDDGNISQEVSDSDSLGSKNGSKGSSGNKVASFSGTSKLKPGSDPPKSHAENEVQPIRRLACADPANASKTDGSVAEIKIQVNLYDNLDSDSSPSGSSCKGTSPGNKITRSATFRTNPSSRNTGSSQNPTLPY